MKFVNLAVLCAAVFLMTACGNKDEQASNNGADSGKNQQTKEGYMQGQRQLSNNADDFLKKYGGKK